MKDQFTAFVVARSGRMRDGLVALLRAVPEIGTVEQLGDDAAVLTNVPHHHQALVLLDASLMNQEVWTLMKQFKSRQSQDHYKYLVLADNGFQQRMALAAGADGVLLAGFPAAEFFATVENLLGRPRRAYLAQTREAV
jgi:DNA-binding NarL/FixJ family response regulator